MPFPMRIQPIEAIRNDAVKPPVLRSRLKRLFDRPFNTVLRISSADKQAAGGENDCGKADCEPSSVCLDKMVQSFIEDSNDKQSVTAAKYGRNRCNCFNGNSNDSSDEEELGFFSDSLTIISSVSDPSDTLKSLIPCASVAERNLLAETSKIVERNNRRCKRKDDLRKIVTDGLIALGYYDAAVCKSKWEKSSSIPAGEYEYIDVIFKGERILIDIDFRSEFEIARSTSGYKSILQCLPSIFVGKSDRLLQILTIASEAAAQSLKQKGMHIAPWRKAEYTKCKWLSPHTRAPQLRLSSLSETGPSGGPPGAQPEPEVVEVTGSECGDLVLIFGEETSSLSATGAEKCESPARFLGEAEPAMLWKLPEVKPKSLERRSKMVVTGLASLLSEKLQK